MVGPEVAEVVGGEQHGRLTIIGAHPETSAVLAMSMLVILALAALAVVLVLVDVVRRGRLRGTAFAICGLLTALPPLIGLYAAADAFAQAMIDAANTNSSNFAVVAPLLLPSALALMMGAAFGGLGVILTFILRLDDAWRGRKGAHPRAPTP